MASKGECQLAEERREAIEYQKKKEIALPIIDTPMMGILSVTCLCLKLRHAQNFYARYNIRIFISDKAERNLK